MGGEEDDPGEKGGGKLGFSRDSRNDFVKGEPDTGRGKEQGAPLISYSSKKKREGEEGRAVRAKRGKIDLH